MRLEAGWLRLGLEQQAPPRFQVARDSQTCGGGDARRLTACESAVHTIHTYIYTHTRMLCVC